MSTVPEPKAESLGRFISYVHGVTGMRLPPSQAAKIWGYFMEIDTAPSTWSPEQWEHHAERLHSAITEIFCEIREQEKK
jgi:hypothetical protein